MGGSGEGAACARYASPLPEGHAGSRISGVGGHRARQSLDGLFNLEPASVYRGNQIMSAFEEHREELEHYEQMFGRDRGRLAVSLDRLTNALVLVGQHAVYCTSQRNPAVPALDLRIINQELVHAKELVQSVMEELRLARAKKEN